MDFNNGNRNSGKRKAQSIQDMINSTPSSNTGIRRSSYSGPKSLNAVPQRDNQNLKGINVNRSDSYDRWGNSNEGMPSPKRPRYKADVGNPMRGNVLKKESQQSKERLNKKAKDIDRDRRTTQASKSRSAAGRPSSRPASSRQSGSRQGYVAPVHGGMLDEFGWAILSGLLTLCVIVTLIASGVKPRSSGYKYPMNVISISGVINNSYEHLMGVKGAFSGGTGTDDTMQGAPMDVAGTEVADDGSTKTVALVDESSLNDLGTEANAAVLDDGTMTIPGITPATSHTELVNQVNNELSTGNYSFISAKFAYADEATGVLNPYPMSVIKHFTSYMQSNPDKQTAFINAISSEEYSAMNGSAYVIKIPMMKFTIKMGESTPSFPLDNTVVSVSGFTDVIVNGNQNAAIYPLLPCMYTMTLTNNAWSTPEQSQEVEATLGEGDLSIKVGKTKDEQ